MYKKAIVRSPGRSMIHGLSQAHLGRPEYELALAQHRAYVQSLQTCGLNVSVLPADETLPDSVFVEDTAVMLEGCAVLTIPGAPSRQQETTAIRAELSRHVPRLAFISGKGRLDGGDVLMIGRTLYIGLSARTNPEGAGQLAHIARDYGYQSVQVPLDTMLHLKTGVNFLEGNIILVTGEFVEKLVFQKFDQIVVPPEEAYAANSLWLNGRVLVPKGFPHTRAMIASRDLPILEVDVSEFRKLDGGLSCLSLRF
jgi:dimethylargininase